MEREKLRTRRIWCLVILLSAISLSLVNCGPPLELAPPLMNPDGTVSEDVSYSVVLNVGTDDGSYGNTPIHFFQQSGWDCGPTVIKMWTQHITNVAARAGRLPVEEDDTLESSVYGRMVNYLGNLSSNRDILPQYAYTGYVRGQYIYQNGYYSEKLPETCLDWVKCKFNDFSLVTDIPGQKGTSVFHSNTFSGRSTLLFTSLFLQELFRYITNSTLESAFATRYGNGWYDDPGHNNDWYDAGMYLTERYPFPPYAGTLNMPYGYLDENLRFRMEITPTEAAGLEQYFVELFATDDEAAFVSSIVEHFHVQGTDDLSPYANNDVNKTNRAILLLTKPNDGAPSLHYVLLYEIKVKLLRGQTFQQAQLEFHVMDPILGIRKNIDISTFRDMIRLTSTYGDPNSSKLLYYRHIGVELGKDGVGRTRSLAKGSERVAQINFGAEARYFSDLRKRREARKALPLIIDLLLSED